MATLVTTDEEKYYEKINEYVHIGASITKIAFAADVLSTYVQSPNAFEGSTQILYISDKTVIPLIKRLVPTAEWF